jgi:hypothetical protein
MACYSVSVKNRSEFLQLIRSRDPEMLIEMANCVLYAIDRDQKEVDILLVKFQTGEGMVISAIESNYKTFLNKCKEDLILIEEYEICAKIQKALIKIDK